MQWKSEHSSSDGRRRLATLYSTSPHITWQEKTPEQARRILEAPDVTVTCQADKDVLLPKLARINAEVRSAWKDEAAKQRWQKTPEQIAQLTQAIERQAVLKQLQSPAARAPMSGNAQARLSRARWKRDTHVVTATSYWSKKAGSKQRRKSSA